MPVYNKFNSHFKVEVPITTNGTAKDAGDVVGGLLSAEITLPNAGAIIRRIRIVDESNQAAALTLYFFDAAPTTIIDDAVFASAMTAADHKKLIDYASVVIAATTDWKVLNSIASAVKKELEIDIKTVDGKVYFYIVCTGTPTYGANALTVYVEGWPD